MGVHAWLARKGASLSLALGLAHCPAVISGFAGAAFGI